MWQQRLLRKHRNNDNESEEKSWNQVDWPALIFQYRETRKPQKINSAFEWIFRRNQQELLSTDHEDQ